MHIEGLGQRRGSAAAATARRASTSGRSSLPSLPRSRSSRSWRQTAALADDCEAPSNTTTSSNSSAAAAAVARRQALAAVAAAVGAGLLSPRRAAADAADASPPQQQQQTPETTAVTPFRDNDYALSYPSSFTYIETPLPAPRRPGGQTPERSPLRARFESADGAETISVVVRRAASIKPTLMQVSDITVYGDALEAAKLLLPRGARLLSVGTSTEALPAKETPLGVVDVPPRSYYRFDFEAPGGLRVAMAAAAQRGTVYVLGASAPAERWAEAQARLGAAVASFRLR